VIQSELEARVELPVFLLLSRLSRSVCPNNIQPKIKILENGEICVENNDWDSINPNKMQKLRSPGQHKQLPTRIVIEIELPRLRFSMPAWVTTGFYFLDG
jgi:hypothetical protein